MKLHLHRMAVLLPSVAGAFLLASDIRAATVFAYTNRDMILTFRQSGAQNDFEVDIGQASTYYGATPGTTIPITQYTTTQLANAFSSLDYLSWSVAAFVPFNGDGGNPGVPDSTLWVTAPRVVNSSTPAPVLGERSATAQGSAANEMNSVQEEAVFYSGTIATNANGNEPGFILIPASSSFAAGTFLGPLGNYSGKFWEDVENNTLTSFDAGLPSRSDLYQLYPNNTGTFPPGTYLGYFELNPGGAMVFVRQNAPAPTLSVSAANSVSTISFSTYVGATYTLYYTNSSGLTAPISSWSSVSTNIIGDGNVHAFQQTSTDAVRFYVVGAH